MFPVFLIFLPCALITAQQAIIESGLQCTGTLGIILDNIVSAVDQKFIVSKHNYLRQQIAKGNITGQPKGTNLKRMTWDAQLAKEAQDIANACVFEHVTVTDKRWAAVGQNLYISYSTAPDSRSDWDSAIQSWFDEHEDYTFGSCCNTNPGKMTGHYTQVVWADTDTVGCGYTYFQTREFWKYKKLYVCNYGPAGNYVGQRPYRTEN